MGCERVEFDLGNGEKATAIVCTRGGRKARCKACGKREHAVLCDYPLAGKKAGKTCDMKLCSACAQRVGPDRDLCPPHAKLVRDARVEAPAVVGPLLADPDPGAMLVVADVVAERELVAPGPAAVAIAAGPPRVLAATPPLLWEDPRDSRLDVGSFGFSGHDRSFQPKDLADWAEFLAERAAVFEYLGELPRQVAELKARELAGPPPRTQGRLL